MRYNFDEIIDRSGTNCMKWDKLEEIFGSEDIIPMWIADMDFAAPTEVVEDIKERASHPIYGYTFRSYAYYEAVKNWMSRRHGWKIEKNWVSFSPGIVSALGFIVNAFTNENDKILVQTPIYPPFKTIVSRNNRKVVESSLEVINGKYNMNFDEIERVIAEENKSEHKIKVMFLCSPHNPGGRVWEVEILEQIAEICLKNNIILVSDEVHSDYIYDGKAHKPIASINKDIERNSITCIAPSKTFNLAGLSTSAIIIPNDDFRKKFEDEVSKVDADGGNIFGSLALKSAYEKGDNWVDELQLYLERNRDYLIDYFNENIKELEVLKPEGGYLAWIDCKKLKLKGDDLRRLFHQQAKVGVSVGDRFGLDGDTHIRVNFACPLETLKEGLNRIKKGVDIRKEELGGEL